MAKSKKVSKKRFVWHSNYRYEVLEKIKTQNGTYLLLGQPDGYRFLLDTEDETFLKDTVKIRLLLKRQHELEIETKQIAEKLEMIWASNGVDESGYGFPVSVDDDRVFIDEDGNFDEKEWKKRHV